MGDVKRLIQQYFSYIEVVSLVMGDESIGIKLTQFHQTPTHFSDRDIPCDGEKGNGSTYNQWC